MIPEHDIPSDSFALLASDAHFSCAVLAALRQQRYLPEIVILPEYPPARQASPAGSELLATAPQRRLLQQAQDITIAYAPASRQSACAQLIEKHAIDFLLVACWPYLIDSVLIDSARKATLNMHPSLLPAFRGPDPLGQQLDCQKCRFGVSLHLLNQQFDQGDIVVQAELPDMEKPLERASLERSCARLGSELFVRAIHQHAQGWQPVKQPI